MGSEVYFNILWKSKCLNLLVILIENSLKIFLDKWVDSGPQRILKNVKILYVHTFSYEYVHSKKFLEDLKDHDDHEKF